jgi:hypothetical protein
MSTMFRLNNNIQVDHRLVKRGVSDYKNVLLECIDCIVLLHANVLFLGMFLSVLVYCNYLFVPLHDINENHFNSTIRTVAT